MNAIALFLSAVCFLLPFASGAVSSTALPSRPEDRQVEASLEIKVRELLRNFDSDATIIVRVSRRSIDASLPSTPFQIRGLNVVAEGSASPYSTINILILGTKSSMPPAVTNLIAQLGSPYGIRPQIQLKSLPRELRREPPPAPFPSPLATAAAATPPGPTVAAAGSASGPESARNVQKFFDGEQLERLASTLARFSGGAVGLFLLVLVVNGLLDRRKSEQIFKRFEGDMHSFAEKFTPNDSSGRERAIASDPRGGPPGGTSVGTVPSAGAVLVRMDTLSLSTEGIAALLSDCYWNELDGYANFLWSRIPFRRKDEVLRAVPELVAYVASLPFSAPVDLGFENDPAYLYPLPTSRLDQAAIGALVRHVPDLLPALSRIRKDRLGIAIGEFLDLHGRIGVDSGSSRAHLEALLRNRAASTPRAIDTTGSMKPQSIEEESEVLARTDVAIPVRARIASLGWSRDLAEDEVEAVLQEYTAKDLAHAWIAPPETLRRLERALPERKRELLRSYLGQITPSRDSAAFSSLHAAFVARLKPNPPDDVSSVAPGMRRAA